MFTDESGSAPNYETLHVYPDDSFAMSSIPVDPEEAAERQTWSNWHGTTVTTHPSDNLPPAREPTGTAIIAAMGVARPEQFSYDPNNLVRSPRRSTQEIQGTMKAVIPPIIYVGNPAKAVTDDVTTPTGMINSRRRCGFILLLFLLLSVMILALVVALVVALAGNSKDESSNDSQGSVFSRPSTTPLLSGSPTIPPTTGDGPLATGVPSLPPVDDYLPPTHPPQSTQQSSSPTHTPSSNQEPTLSRTPTTPSQTSTSRPTESPTVVPTTPASTSEPTPQATSRTAQPTVRATSEPTIAPSPWPPPASTQPTVGDTPERTIAPSPWPTSTRTPIFEKLRAYILSISFDEGNALLDSNSPQSRALEWLAGEPIAGSYSNQKVRQRYVLATLYFSTNGDRWSDSESWLSERSECEWYKANDDKDEVCDAGLVLDNIDLRDNNLSGPIPPELGLLSDTLVYLFISGNRLSGTIPSQLGKLTKLKRLQAKSNNLTGTLPSDLGTMDQLNALGVGRNQLRGQLPEEISGLSFLISLGLERNTFSGTIPSTYGLMTDLRTVAMDYNQDLRGSIPHEIENWTKLDWLHLDSTSLTGFIPQQLCSVAFRIRTDCDVTCACCEGCR